jgi:hypothetical protein
VEATDPWLRAVSGYRKKLRPAVIRAMDHVVALVDGLPPPVSLDPANYADDLRLKSLFISSDEMNRLLAGDRSLAQFFRGPGSGASRVVALLAMEKLNLLEREGWGFDRADASQKIGVAEVEERIGEIENQLRELGGDDRMLGRYLEIVADLLGRPEEHFWARNETIFVGRMGVKRSEAAKDASELTYSELHNAEGRSMVVMPGSLPGEELKRFHP